MAKTPQFGAKFAPGVKYLRHKNGIVYPYMAILAENPDYSVVEFRQNVEIQQRPLGFTPPPPDAAEEKEEKKQEVEKIDDLKGSIDRALLNPPLPEAAIKPVPVPAVTAQLLSGLDVAGE